MNTYISKIDGKWYPYAGDENRNQVYSIGKDCPDDGGMWFARWNAIGVKYVSHGCRTRNGAYAYAKKYGYYQGEIRVF